VIYSFSIAIHVGIHHHFSSFFSECKLVGSFLQSFSLWTSSYTTEWRTPESTLHRMLSIKFSQKHDAARWKSDTLDATCSSVSTERLLFSALRSIWPTFRLRWEAGCGQFCRGTIRVALSTTGHKLLVITTLWLVPHALSGSGGKSVGWNTFQRRPARSLQTLLHRSPRDGVKGTFTR